MIKTFLPDFGFCGIRSLFCSVTRVESSGFLTIFAMLGTAISELVGLHAYSLKVILVLLAAELILGIWAGVRRFGKFRGKRLERFGLKLFIYFLLLLVLHTFTLQYEKGTAEYYVYSSLHSFVVFYVIGVYVISVLEKVNILTGGKSPELNTLINLFKFRLKQAVEKTKEEPNKQ